MREERVIWFKMHSMHNDARDTCRVFRPPATGPATRKLMDAAQNIKGRGDTALKLQIGKYD